MFWIICAVILFYFLVQSAIWLVQMIGVWCLFTLLFFVGGIFFCIRSIFKKKENDEIIEYAKYMQERRRLKKEAKAKKLAFMKQQEIDKQKEIEDRRKCLMLMYNNDSFVVNGILAHQYWQGQTQSQLIDSIGEPQDIDRNVMKTKVLETYKYKCIGKNRYAFRIFLENGNVIGWKGSLENKKENEESDDKK